MYKYTAEQEQRIKADRERLKRYGEAVQIVRAAARAELPGEAVKRAGEDIKIIDSYIAKLQGVELIIFDMHYRRGASLAVVGDMLGRSASGCNDLIRRQLAAVSLDGERGEIAPKRRTMRVKREQPRKPRYFRKI